MPTLIKDLCVNHFFFCLINVSGIVLLFCSAFSLSETVLPKSSLYDPEKERLHGDPWLAAIGKTDGRRCKSVPSSDCIVWKACGLREECIYRVPNGTLIDFDYMSPKLEHFKMFSN